MPGQDMLHDRRTFPRFTGNDLQLTIRRRGRIGSARGIVLDFNRYGAAVLMAEPLLQNLPVDKKDQEVFITLRHGEVRIDNVVGVVHTCLSLEDGFRCGIQFRTRSSRQFDKEQVERALLRLEREFVASVPTPDSPLRETSAFH